MAGAYGVLVNLKKMVQTLLLIDQIQIIIVCGRNKTLHTRMATNFAYEFRVRIFAFYEQMEELMSITSCMITKAGGITLSEAIALRLPVIIFRPLPGQEKENAKFLAGKGAIQIANHFAKLKKQVEQMITTSQSLHMQQAMLALEKRDASDRIVTDILEGIKYI